MMERCWLEKQCAKSRDGLLVLLLAWFVVVVPAELAHAGETALPIDTPHAEAFVNLTPLRGTEKATTVTYQGIPFAVIASIRGYKNLVPVSLNEIKQPLAQLFLLGLATDRPEGSEQWRQSERYYSQRPRLFIGDRMGRVTIEYEDLTNEIIPLIFGVNVWCYELCTPLKPGEEKYLRNFGVTYDEPFASDPEAARLLGESLHMMVNDTVKGGRFIFGMTPQPKTIARVAITADDFRVAGFQVTAVTGLKPGVLKSLPKAWKVYDERYFGQKKYYPAMDRLARRFYQFRDELPSQVQLAPPPGYQGPQVQFTGNGLADIFTNVYLHNIWDMAREKVDADGLPHSSSRNATDFGQYVGFGSFKNGVGRYTSQAWSRDAGPCLAELVEWGETERTKKAGEDCLEKYLYDPNPRFKQPNWKRVINSQIYASCKENDGHGVLMLFIYRLIEHGCVDRAWVKAHWKNIRDAAEWFCWQMDNPKESGFEKVLSSESEASTQRYGMRDLYSNANAWYGLMAFSRLARQMGEAGQARRWEQYADRLKLGIMECFTSEHPRFGKIFVDTTYDSWTWEYKAQAPLFLYTDLFGYDPFVDAPELFKLARATYQAQKEDYFSYGVGRQMGYGQGFVTQAAILMDDPQDMQGYVEQAAAFCYHHTDRNWIVPEGVVMHPSGRFWFRNGDQGNCVQQSEIVKCARMLIGLDDLSPDKGLSLIPRLPQGWASLAVKDYPVVVQVSGQAARRPVDYSYARVGEGYRVSLTIDAAAKLNQLRVGPFAVGTRAVRVKGARGLKVARLLTHENGAVFAYVDLSKFKGGRFEIKIQPR